ncbi:MAG: hypothetical protein A3G41_03655 [Elusimicrobia bacterium RIFCSPLOWO2_12_FULL_59_9]|nr:MAG: hypothetical protein A3G41_03655 [Elusimicrobia bacterium RIFCSPLOWO2_12_FULL_59_9]
MQNRWIRGAGMILGTLACLYGMVYADLVLRARSAYMQGERYLRWHDHPDEKAAFFEQKFAINKVKLDKELAAGALSRPEYDQKLDLIRFEQEEAVRESSAKYAYIWHQTAVELFSPPESRWVQLSRQRMRQAKELWEKELHAKGIPFKDYMLE